MNSCEKHVWETIGTVPRKAHSEGSKHYRAGFNDAKMRGINISVARRKKCKNCDKKITTVEITHDQLKSIFNILDEHGIKLSDATNSKLSKIERSVRKYLIRVCKGYEKTHHLKKVTYKEVWEHVYPNVPWGQIRTNDVVAWIVKISEHDLPKGRPPLNSIVVRKDTGMPGEKWESWKEYWEEKNYLIPFNTMEEAQAACWDYCWK
ncbi:hypothetical protein GCM10023116_16090 [Kistimonas scapharcae]|uniref:Uncharacterized protein n=2 Tax=Kistimonas scapharcae TaxID=1036133 RepID=A0ABP8UZS0_9GAMM